MPIQISCLYFILYFLFIKLNGYSLVTGWPHSKPNHPPPDGTTEGSSHEEHWKNVGRSTRRSPRGKFWNHNLLESLMGSIHIVWKGVFYAFSDWITKKWKHQRSKERSFRFWQTLYRTTPGPNASQLGELWCWRGVGSSAKMLFSRSYSNAYKWSSGQMTVGHQSLVGI